MVCCIIAAYIYAQLVAAMRRWCIYWGLMRRGPYDREPPTFLDNVRGRGPRPSFATLAMSAMLIGLAGTWTMGGFERTAHDPAATVSEEAIPRLSQLIGLGAIRP